MKKLSSLLVMILVLVMVFTITAYADEEEIPEPDPPPPSRVIVIDHYLTGDGIIAGEQSTLVLSLYNTSPEFPVSSILVTGWLDQGAPVVFVGANQTYLPVIEPDSVVEVRFDLYAHNIDLTLIRTITSNFLIEFFDESSWIDRSNNILIKLDVPSTPGGAISDEDMSYQTPELSRLEETLFSSGMRNLYYVGLILCCSGVLLVLLFRLYKRIADSKGGKRNV